MKLCIITPVGPGHEAAYQECRASIERAVAHSQGPFSEIVPLMMDDTQGLHGRSRRRNDGIRQAGEMGADWIYFLDADDILVPNAFEVVAHYIENYDAIWGLICENSFGSSGVTLRDGQIAPTDSIREILFNDPYLTIQMGHFVRTAVAASVGFDETLDTGEDFKYYLEVWKRVPCAKVSEIFFVNRRGNHSQGPRSADGGQWRRNVTRILSEFVWSNGVAVEVEHRDDKAIFAVSNPFDLIQQNWIAGRFFETPELEYLANLVGPNRRILEVGANFGNHVVYYLRHMKPAGIIAIEPNPEASKVLHRNVAANAGGIPVEILEMGVGAKFGSFRVQVDQPNNLGAAKLAPDSRGTVKVYPIDVKIKEPVEFIKIDVEGMEMEVLKGAKQTIARNRPIIFIEIMNANIPAFETWVKSAGYRVEHIFHNVHAKNFVVVPA